MKAAKYKIQFSDSFIRNTKCSNLNILILYCVIFSYQLSNITVNTNFVATFFIIKQFF